MFLTLKRLQLVVVMLLTGVSVLGQKKSSDSDKNLSITEIRTRLLKISSSAGGAFSAISNGFTKHKGYYYGVGTFQLLEGHDSFISRNNPIYFTYIIENGSKKQSVTEYDSWRGLLAKALPEYDSVSYTFPDITHLYFYPWDSKKAFIELKRSKAQSGWNISLGVVEPNDDNYQKFNTEKIASLKNNSGKPTIAKKIIASDGTIHKAADFDGVGKYLFDSGEWYDGEIKNGLFNGFGKLVTPGRGIYKGFFKNHKFEGRGFDLYENGNWYDGDFVNGVREGKGVWMMYKGQQWQKYTGDFKDNEITGEGIMRDQVNNRAIGTFLKGIPVPGKHTVIRWPN